MKTAEFITKYAPCRQGQNFAEQFENMSEVWLACENPQWLFWILEKHAPLTKEQAVMLARGFANTNTNTNTNTKAENYALAATNYAATAEDAANFTALVVFASNAPAKCAFIRAAIPNPF